jgi:2',3'-cyclic-nucleotide 2'-phosphodiesterase/3'-nucleotidase
MSRRTETGPSEFRLTVLGTADLHGYVLNWDYVTDAEFGDQQHNHVGLAKIATLIRRVRADRGVCSTLTVDAGDTIQGTPLAFYYARQDPITESRSAGRPAPVHPMATAMNAVGYDAAAVGNHEFNYGLPVLRAFEGQCRHPLLAANVFDWVTGAPAFPPYLLKRVPLGDHHDHPANHPHGPDTESLIVGIVGFVTPGCAIWDRAYLDGRLRFTGIVEQAAVTIPEVRAAGAEIVIVLCHSGADTSSSYGDALPWPENASALLAEQVPGIDAILVGHAHAELPERFVTNAMTGAPVLLSEPLKWGQRLSVLDFELHRPSGGAWSVRRSSSYLLNANEVAEDRTVAALVADQHRRVRGYVNTVIGTCEQAMSMADARYRPAPALDLIHHVQASTMRAALRQQADPAADLPLLSGASAFSLDAGLPAGPVSVRDVAGLYNYDNTPVAIRLTGAQLRGYLEHSAAYFQRVDGVGPFQPDRLTNAVTEAAPHGTPDYNYDTVAGLDHALSYDIDLARPTGSRISRLRYGASPVTDGQPFVLVVNNYRQSGGGNFPHLRQAPVVWETSAEIRQLIIDWVREQGEIRPSMFRPQQWRLVYNGSPVLFS